MLRGKIIVRQCVHGWRTSDASHTHRQRAEVAEKEIEVAGYLFARRKMAKMSKAIRPMPMTQPKIHIGHIIIPPIPSIIPPLDP